MASVNIRLLGGFEVKLDSGQAVSLTGRKTQALVAFLALPPGEPRTREKLTALLWSDRGDQQARSSLRQALTELRKALSGLDPPPLVAERDAVSLDATMVEVDVADFERLINDGTPESLQRATELYHGEFLDGLGVHDPAFEEWMRDERARLHECAREAVSRLLEHQMAVGETDKALATAKRLLALDPLQEEAHRSLMRIYADKGDRALALKQYQTCCDVLRAELGIEPDAGTQRLQEEIRHGHEPIRGVLADLPHEKGGHEPPALPDKPSIAVLPFVNMSGDAEQEYFSEGITEDIITELSRFRNLFVIARNSSFTYKGRSVRVQEVGRELGVQFVLEGSVRKSGNKVRVTAQLVDAGTGHHVWADRYDREVEEIFAVQDEITQTIVATLAGRLEDATREAAKRKSTENLAAYDYVLRGDEEVFLFTKERTAQSRDMYSKALELDPRYARAYVGVAHSYAADWGFLWGEDPDEDLNRAFEYAQKAVALDDAESRAHGVMALVHVFRKEYSQARRHQQKAVALNPNDADALAHGSYVVSLLGDHQEAIELGEKAVRLNPYYPVWYLTFLGGNYYAAQRYGDAVAAFEGTRNLYPDDAAWLAASYAQLGRLDDARTVMAEFLELGGTDPWWARAPKSAAIAERDPTGLLRYIIYMYPYRNPSDLDHLLDGLRKAGLPE